MRFSRRKSGAILIAQETHGTSPASPLGVPAQRGKAGSVKDIWD